MNTKNRGFINDIMLNSTIEIILSSLRNNQCIVTSTFMLPKIIKRIEKKGVLFHIKNDTTHKDTTIHVLGCDCINI